MKDQRTRCRARNRQGNQCAKYAIPGGTVCRMHGGAAPQVIRSANIRLIELINPAIAALARELLKGDTSADRVRAANSILDRAGVVRRVDGPSVEDAQALLVARLLALRDQTKTGKNEDTE